ELTRQAARRAKSESLFTTYLIIFLVPYAIFVTGVAAYFYLRMLDMQQRAPHPLEYLRDSGENPPAKRGSSSVFESISPDTNLTGNGKRNTAPVDRIRCWRSAAKSSSVVRSNGGREPIAGRFAPTTRANTSRAKRRTTKCSSRAPIEPRSSVPIPASARFCK